MPDRCDRVSVRRQADRKGLVPARSGADLSASREEIARPDGRAETKTLPVSSAKPREFS